MENKQELNFSIDLDVDGKKFTKDANFITSLVIENANHMQISAIVEGLAIVFYEVTRCMSEEVKKDYLEQFEQTVRSSQASKQEPHEP